MTPLSKQAETGSADRDAAALALDEIDALRAENARLREAIDKACLIWGDQVAGDLDGDWEDAADDMHNVLTQATSHE